MKRPGRILSAAAATVLLTALTASGCGTPAGSTFARRPGEAVNVIVEWDEGAGKVVVSNDTVYPRAEKDWVQWVSPDGEVSVTFKSDSPFPETPKRVKKVLKSKPPKKGAAGMGFKYTVTLVLADGPHDLDPRIEVLP